jgi:hypothetical protein
MTEKEMFTVLYARHEKMMINLAEACRHKDFGMSYSKASKIFGGKNALAESTILKNKILPKWEKTNNGIRLWKLTEIAKWLVETEEKNSYA